MPVNLTGAKIPAKRLKVALSRAPPANNPDVENYVIDEIVKLVDGAKQDIVVLVDACAIRHHVREEVNDLLTNTQFPVYASPMGKTVVSEEYERYGGVSVHLSFIYGRPEPFRRSTSALSHIHPSRRR